MSEEGTPEIVEEPGDLPEGNKPGEIKGPDPAQHPQPEPEGEEPPADV